MSSIELCGIYFGYPKCCVDWFIRNRMNNYIPLNKNQEAVHGNEGFIPCPKCAKKVNKDTIHTLIRNRVCKSPYPNQGRFYKSKTLLNKIIKYYESLTTDRFL